MKSDEGPEFADISKSQIYFHSLCVCPIWFGCCMVSDVAFDAPIGLLDKHGCHGFWQDTPFSWQQNLTCRFFERCDSTSRAFMRHQHQGTNMRNNWHMHAYIEYILCSFSLEFFQGHRCELKSKTQKVQKGGALLFAHCWVKLILVLAHICNCRLRSLSRPVLSKCTQGHFVAQLCMTTMMTVPPMAFPIKARQRITQTFND